MLRPALLVALLVHASSPAFADDFPDLGNCKETVFGPKGNEVSATTIERDAKHRIVKLIPKPRGDVQTREYDAAGRLTTIHIGDIRVANTYDPKTGRLDRTDEFEAKATTPSRTWTRDYDPKTGQLIHQVAKQGDKIVIEKDFTYDKANRIAAIAMDHGATTETHHYDDRGRLDTNAVVVSGQKIVFTYKYDDHDRRTEQANPKGRIEYSYTCK